jgi:hypothetical protein
MPLTTPVLLTVATLVFSLLHAPPVDEALNVVVLPGQTVAMPEINPGTGSGITVSTVVVTAVPQLFVFV